MYDCVMHKQSIEHDIRTTASHHERAERSTGEQLGAELKTLEHTLRAFAGMCNVAASDTAPLATLQAEIRAYMSAQGEDSASLKLDAIRHLCESPTIEGDERILLRRLITVRSLTKALKEKIPHHDGEETSATPEVSTENTYVRVRSRVKGSVVPFVVRALHTEAPRPQVASVVAGGEKPSASHERNTRRAFIAPVTSEHGTYSLASVLKNYLGTQRLRTPDERRAMDWFAHAFTRYVNEEPEERIAKLTHRSDLPKGITASTIPTQAFGERVELSYGEVLSNSAFWKWFDAFYARRLTSSLRQEGFAGLRSEIATLSAHLKNEFGITE